MSRPEVSVVMPFGGTASELRAALDSLRAVDWQPGDELILADNSRHAAAQRAPQTASAGMPLTVVPVSGEASPAHARNVGADAASTEWLLFLDADCRPLPGLLESYFRSDVAEDVGALAGEVLGGGDAGTLAARYGAARNFLSQQDHMSHPYLPRATAANLLVRRRAFDAVGGFYEGVRAAEDTDFSWRLQQDGWRLELCREARAEHRYRTSLADLRRQWRAYAAGRAWLSRRYEGFEPEPAAMRAVGRVRQLLRNLRSGSPQGLAAPHGRHAWREQAPFLALDAVLALEELAGLALSNRPLGAASNAGAEVILIADEFPRRDDPLVELAVTLGRARVEAVARPHVPDLAATRQLTVHYLEDEGMATRAAAGFSLAVAHPLRVARDLVIRSSGEPSTWSLAPAARRLERDPRARLHVLGGRSAKALAERLGRLAARPIE